MTKVTVRREKDRYEIVAKGHATPEGPPQKRSSAFVGKGETAKRASPGACDRERDVELVSTRGCAYISGILYSLAGYLQNEVWIQAEERRMEPGDVVLRFRGGKEARAAYEMAVIGLKQLEGSYPEIIRVEER